MAPSDATPPGARFRLGNYELLIELAAGGMATVYAARQIGAAGFERLVVVKRVHRHLLRDQGFYDMFRDEARVASLIRHPNVVSVTDVVEFEGELFLVMDYVESTALSTLQRATRDLGVRLPPAVGVRIIADTLAGLHAAHEAVDMRGERLDVVHRDVSPQNIIVGVDGTSRLLDFGVAKAAHRITETRSGSIKGKLPYMSPEGVRGMPLDRRADIFAAGVVLHETLTGERLFQGSNELETLQRVSEAKATDPSLLVEGIPRALDLVVRRALAPDPARRYGTAAEFLDELEAAIAPAHVRQVWACLERYCGERIEVRRGELRALMDGSLLPKVSPRRDEVPTPIQGAFATGRTSAPSLHSVSDIQSVPSMPGASAHPLEVVTESAIAASRLPPPMSAPPSKSRGLVIAAFASGLVFTTASAAFLLIERGPAEGPIEARPGVSIAAPAPAPPIASAAALGPDVEIVIFAPAPIESVRAAGMRRLDIEGTRARLFVGAWQGGLPIEVVLAKGRVMTEIALADGSREIHLGGASPPPPQVEVAPAKSAKPRAAAPHAPDDPELHENPY